MARPKQVSDAQLLAMAHKVFLKEGPNAPVSLVARRLGVTAAALFHRVGSKDQLLTMAMAPPEPPAIEILKKGYQTGTPPAAQLVEILFGLVSYLTTVIPSGFCLQTGGVQYPPRNSSYSNYPYTLRKCMASWLAQAQTAGGLRAGDPEIMAEVMVGTLESRYTLAHLNRKKIPRQDSRKFVEAMVRDVLRTR
jgi:AcrR family transcriptional regulator